MTAHRPWLSEIIRRIDALDISDYVTQIRRNGRSLLTTTTREQFMATHAEIQHVTRDTTGSYHLYAQLLDLTTRLTSTESDLASDPVPGYNAYANLPVLQWCLSQHGDAPCNPTDDHVWRVIGVLTQDLLRWHLETLWYQPTAVGTTSDREIRSDKVLQLVDVVHRAMGRLPKLPEIQHPPRFLRVYLLDSPDLVVALLTALPQTTVTDEYLYLRSVHLTEAALYGALPHLKAAIELLRERMRSEAINRLERARRFMALLVPIMHMVRAMAPQSFLGFQQAAGNVSAVQSRNYQMLDAYLHGVPPEKHAILAEIPEVRDLLDCSSPSFRPLCSFFATDECDALSLAVNNAIVAVERPLYAWKKYHELQLVAADCLSIENIETGDTRGPRYLSSHKSRRPGVVNADENTSRVPESTH